MTDVSKKVHQPDIEAQANLQTLIEPHVPEALRVLVDVMRDRRAPPNARMTAAIELLNRRHGTPSQGFVIKESVVDPAVEARRQQLLGNLRENLTAFRRSAARNTEILTARQRPLETRGRKRKGPKAP